MDAIDLQGSSPVPCLSVTRLVVAPVQNSTSTSLDGRKRCPRIQWEPSVVYLDKSQYSTIFAVSPANSSIIEDLWKLERLSFSYVNDAVSQNMGDSITAPHHKKLFSWMEKQVRLVRDGQNRGLGPELIGMPEIEKQLLRESTRTMGAGALLFSRIGECLVEDDLLSRFYAESDTYKRRYVLAAKYMERLAHQSPGLRIIEIGAGAAGTTVPLLEALGGNAGAPAKFAQYDFTDASTGSFESAKAKLAPWGQLIKFERLNIERPSMEQGFQAEYYDVMVASDVLHAATDMPNTMRNVGTGLVGGGRGEESDQEGIRSYGHDDGVDDDGQY